MFQWLFGKEGNTKTIAILDVGSGSVGAALATLNRTGQPELLYTTREELPLRMTRKGSELAKDVVGASGRVLALVRKEAALFNEGNRIVPKRIEHLAVFLAAPWSTTHIRTLRFSRTKPFPMSADVLRRMLDDEARSAGREREKDLEMIERTATGLRLNGYPVDALSNAPVLEAEVTLATSFAPRAFLEMLDDSLGGMPHGTHRTFHSFALPASNALPRVIPALLDTLIIDAGAEVTELIRLKDKTPTARATAPVGTHMLLRTLFAHGRMHRKEAETALKLANLDGTRLSETHKGAIAGAAREWSRGVSLALQSLTVGESMPQSVHLFANQPAEHWLKEALGREPYPNQSTTFGDIHIVTHKDFAGAVTLRGATPDPFLCAELLYADTRFDEKSSLELLSTRDPLLMRPKSVTIPSSVENTVGEPEVSLSSKT